MTRVYSNTPIEVHCDDGLPQRFKWRDRWRHIVAIREHSLAQWEWWHQEVSRRHYAVECEGLEEYEIYQEGDRWFLERVWD
jgi:hypothetical protein